MARLNRYNAEAVMSDGLISGGDFPIMEAYDILVGEDGTRLDAELEAIKARVEELHQVYTWVGLNTYLFNGDETSVNILKRNAVKYRFKGSISP